MPEVTAQCYPWGATRAGLLSTLTSIDLPEIDDISELIGNAVRDSVKIAVGEGHNPIEAPFCVLVNFK